MRILIASKSLGRVEPAIKRENERMSSDKKSEKKAKKNKRKNTNYIIIFEGPKDGVTTTDWDKKKYGPVEKNLSKLGDIEPLFPAPKPMVRLWSSKKRVSPKHVKKAVTEGLDISKGSAFVIERPSGKVWTWPNPEKKSAEGKPSKKWLKRH